MAYIEGRNIEPRAFVVEEAAEEELLRIHFTHPGKMEGAGKLKQHDNVHKQITTFEKLLQHAMSRFSKEKLYQMLRVLRRGIPEIPKVPHHRDKGGSDVDEESVESLGHLKEIIYHFKNGRRRGIQKEEETHLVSYFETLFDDVTYLKDLKSHFDEKIYCCLYDYFYDPLDDINGAFNIDFTGNKALIILHDEERDSGHSSMPGSEEEHGNKPSRRVKFQSLDGIKEEPGVKLDHMNDKEKLSYAVRELYHINQNWDKLMTDDVIDYDWFEVDSHYELLEFSRYESFQIVLRLVPDIFVKAFKSAELAKLWWTQANKVYPQTPNAGVRNSNREFITKVEALERSIKELVLNISEDEKLLRKTKLDFQALKDRENRYNTLSLGCERVEELLNETNSSYKELYQRRDGLKHDLENLLLGTDKYKFTESKLHKYDQKLIQMNGTLKLLKYHFGILQGDFNLELEVRSNIIRFAADVQGTVRDLEDSLIIKRQIKRQAEKQIVLLRTNCERMRKIMKKRVRTSDQDATKEQNLKTEKKRSRRRPTSSERKAARERLQEAQHMKEKITLPDHMRPRRDATFVTSAASDQEAQDGQEPTGQYFDSLEVERVRLPSETNSNRSRGSNNRKGRQRTRHNSNNSRSKGTTTGKISEPRYYSDYDSDFSDTRSKVDGEKGKQIPKRISRKDRDKRRQNSSSNEKGYHSMNSHRTRSNSPDRRHRRQRGRQCDR